MHRCCVCLLAIGFATFAATAHAENVIILKAGNYSLNETRQSLDGDYFRPPTQVTLDRNGTLYGVEYEWRFRNGFSLGAEYAQSTHAYVETTASNSVYSSADFVLETHIANGKKYFEPANWFLPYVGIGIGGAEAVLQAGARTFSGFAAQMLIGAEFRFNRFGIYTGAKWVSSTVNGSDNTLDVSGRSYSGGASIHF